MFTGIVHGLGRARLGGRTIAVYCPGFRAAVAPQLGDSVAVDGVCLTVAALERGGFTADSSQETLKRSTLAERAGTGAMVNLEPALRLQDRLGGHLVSGHVDGTGRILDLEPQEGAWHVDIGWDDPAFGRYVVAKGSIAVDGISLTVAACSTAGDRFRIAVIPASWHGTTLQYRQVGERVNLEADIIAKYSERLLGHHHQSAAGDRLAGGSRTGTDAISSAWLAEQGWG